MSDSLRPRRVQALVSPFGISFLHPKNPYMIAWWSAAFPGFGHLILHQYVRGVLLTLTEVAINTLAHVNETLIYSFTGRFELAKDTLEVRWAIGYMIIYMMSIWDSFKNAQSINKLQVLANLENSRIKPYIISPCEIQYLEKRNPYIAALYSLFFPGMGQLYVHRVGLAFYAMFWWWIYISLSYAHVSVHHHLLGQLSESVKTLHCHWLLFMPSVTGGSVYHAFVTACEHNRLFRTEQRQYFRDRYGGSDICIMPG